MGAVTQVFIFNNRHGKNSCIEIQIAFTDSCPQPLRTYPHKETESKSVIISDNSDNFIPPRAISDAHLNC